MPNCACSDAKKSATFATPTDAHFGNVYNALMKTCDQVATDKPKEMALYQCRECATYWAEGCYDRGMVLFYYLFPVKLVGDPAQWLKNEAKELPVL